MAKVKLETVEKEGKKSYSKEYEQELAEKVLRKSKGWKLADSRYDFKDGTLIEKSKQPAKKSD